MNTEIVFAVSTDVDTGRKTGLKVLAVAGDAIVSILTRILIGTVHGRRNVRLCCWYRRLMSEDSNERKGKGGKRIKENVWIKPS